MKRSYVKWFSPNLNKEAELLVFGCSGTPVILFPTRTARFYDYENWKIIQAISDKIERGCLQVFCVDSHDAESFYAAVHPSEKIGRHLGYESYILNEVIPFIRQVNFNTNLMAAGCSLGGYHAVNITFKYPHLFSAVLGMSARYDLTLKAETFPDLFMGYFDENIYYNMPAMFIPNLNDENILSHLRKLRITLVVGREDPFLENNLLLSNALAGKEIPHAFHVWDEEAHRPRYWRLMMQMYLN